jgi:hypothetical protein
MHPAATQINTHVPPALGKGQKKLCRAPKTMVQTKMMVSMTADHHLAFCHNHLKPGNLQERFDQDDGLARR